MNENKRCTGKLNENKHKTEHVRNFLVVLFVCLFFFFSLY